MFTDNPKSFVTTLYGTSSAGTLPVSTITGSMYGDENGWLTLGSSGWSREAQVFSFEFIERVGERLHYKVTAAPGTPYQDRYLNISRNGYLGFYASEPEGGYWKIEVLPKSKGNELYFWLRDAYGRRVGRYDTEMRTKPPVIPLPVGSAAFSFLNVVEGDDIVTFHAGAIRLF